MKKNKKILVTRLADGIDDLSAGVLPDKLAEQAAEHRKISGLLHTAYASVPADARLAHFGTRVLARARAEKAPGLIERLAKLWYTVFRHPFLALGTTMCVLVLCTATVVYIRNYSHAEPVQMESFVIHQTPDGNGFVRYFKYYKVDSDGNKILL
jgi:hypothetical protein